MRASIVLIAASLLAACAVESSNTQAPASESQYVTGSNIPRRDPKGTGVKTYDSIDSSAATRAGGAAQTR